MSNIKSDCIHSKLNIFERFMQIAFLLAFIFFSLSLAHRLVQYQPLCFQKHLFFYKHSRSLIFPPTHTLREQITPNKSNLKWRWKKGWMKSHSRFPNNSKFKYLFCHLHRIINCIMNRHTVIFIWWRNQLHGTHIRSVDCW